MGIAGLEGGGGGEELACIPCLAFPVPGSFVVLVHGITTTIRQGMYNSEKTKFHKKKHNKFHQKQLFKK